MRLPGQWNTVILHNQAIDSGEQKIHNFRNTGFDLTHKRAHCKCLLTEDWPGRSSQGGYSTLSTVRKAWAVEDTDQGRRPQRSRSSSLYLTGPWTAVATFAGRARTGQSSADPVLLQLTPNPDLHCQEGSLCRCLVVPAHGAPRWPHVQWYLNALCLKQRLRTQMLSQRCWTQRDGLGCVQNYEQSKYLTKCTKYKCSHV